MASIRIIGEKLHGNGMKGVYTAEETLKSGLLPKLLKLLSKLLKKSPGFPGLFALLDQNELDPAVFPPVFTVGALNHRFGTAHSYG